MADISKEEKLLTVTKSLFDYTKGVKDAFSGVLEKVDDATNSANKLRIQFQQSFGMFSAEDGRKLVKNFADVSSELAKQGISAEKLGEAYKIVGTGINSFIVNRSAEAVESFSKLAAVNEKFGVDMQSTVGVINYLSTGFGKNTEEVTKFSNKLMQFSRETGQEFKKVFQDFNQSIQYFYTILDPNKAATQFMSFQQMAKGFGSTVSELMGVAAKFDDMEQGVQFGAQLNNVLSAVGGSFDAVFASMQSYDDSMKLVIQSIANSRDQINSMSEVSQRAYVRQLQQTTGLSGQTIQAILKNNELVNSIDQLTSKEFDQIKEAPVDKMTDNFTTFQDRANLFMSQYLKVGARLEAFFDQSSKNIRDTQLRILGKTTDLITPAKDIKHLVRNITKAFSGDFIKKELEDAKDEIIKKNTENLRKSLLKGLAPGSTSALEYRVKPPGKTELPSGKGEKIPVYNPNAMREDVKQGAAAGIEIAAKKALVDLSKAALASHEIVVHVRPTDELKALLKGPSGAVILGAARSRTTTP